MFKKLKRKITRMYRKMRRERELRAMDEIWSLYGGSCFGLFPPSFYRKHSEEEIRKREKEEIAKLKKQLYEMYGISVVK